MRPIVYGPVRDYTPLPVRLGRVDVLRAPLAIGDRVIATVGTLDEWAGTGLVQVGEELMEVEMVGPSEMRVIERPAFGTAEATHEAGAVVMERPNEYRFIETEETK